jgi:hypothetical protein
MYEKIVEKLKAATGVRLKTMSFPTKCNVWNTFDAARSKIAVIDHNSPHADDKVPKGHSAPIVRVHHGPAGRSNERKGRPMQMNIEGYNIPKRGAR